MKAWKGRLYMELAKVTSKGQITIPIQIRKKLNLKEGDKVVFISEGDKVVLENFTKLVFKKEKSQ